MERNIANAIVLTPEEAADSIFQGAIESGLLRPGVYRDPTVSVVDGRVTLTYSEYLPRVRRRVRYSHRRSRSSIGLGQILGCLFAMLILFLVLEAWLLRSEQPVNPQTSPSFPASPITSSACW